MKTIFLKLCSYIESEIFFKEFIKNNTIVSLNGETIYFKNGEFVTNSTDENFFENNDVNSLFDRELIKVIELHSFSKILNGDITNDYIFITDLDDAEIMEISNNINDFKNKIKSLGYEIHWIYSNPSISFLIPEATLDLHENFFNLIWIGSLMDKKINIFNYENVKDEVFKYLKNSENKVKILLEQLDKYNKFLENFRITKTIKLNIFEFLDVQKISKNKFISILEHMNEV